MLVTDGVEDSAEGKAGLEEAVSGDGEEGSEADEQQTERKRRPANGHASHYILTTSMNFALSETERAFAAEVRAFLAAHPPARFPVDGMDAGYGSGANSRAFLRALASRGWLSMCWPAAYGGEERPMFWKLILMEELALANAPFGPLAGAGEPATIDTLLMTEHGVIPAVVRRTGGRPRDRVAPRGHDPGHVPTT